MQKTQEMWVRSLGQEDPLEEGMATHSSILARKIPWTEEPGRLWPIGLDTTKHVHSTPKASEKFLQSSQQCLLLLSSLSAR